MLTMVIAPYAGLMLASPILIAMAFYDLRYMHIPKWVSGGLIAIFVVMGLTLVPWAESGARMAVAAGVFATGFAAFAMRLIGGGDVKALSALMLLIPVPALTLFMLAFAACLMIGIFGVLVTRHLYGRTDTAWVFLQNKAFPMGISIAGAGLVVPVAAWLM
jgi:prepilin peptidase CpaA